MRYGDGGTGSLEGRPTAEQVRAFRAMSPPEQAANMRHDRDYAHEGPAFGYLKSAHPRASDAGIKQAHRSRTV
jgi:hypothetical protein